MTANIYGRSYPLEPDRPGPGNGLKVVIALAVSAAVGIGIWTYLDARNADMWFVNGLGVPVEIMFGRETVYLEAHSHAQRTVSPGLYDLSVVTLAGETMALETVEVPGFTDVVAYNVLGAADLYAERIVYRAIAIGDEKIASQIYVGETFVTRDNVYYLFERPPSKIIVPPDSAPQPLPVPPIADRFEATTRWYFGFVQPDAWGWKSSLDVLVEQERITDAQQLAQEIDQWDPEAGARVYLNASVRRARPW